MRTERFCHKGDGDDCGSITMRSLFSLPARTTSAWFAKSRSLTRSCKASVIRRPVSDSSSANKACWLIKLCQHRGNLIRRKHHRNASCHLRSSDVIHPRQADTQHLAIQERQRRQGQTMTGRRQTSLTRQVRQIGLDFRAAHLAGSRRPCQQMKALAQWT